MRLSNLDAVNRLVRRRDELVRFAATRPADLVITAFSLDIGMTLEAFPTAYAEVRKAADHELVATDARLQSLGVEVDQ